MAKPILLIDMDGVQVDYYGHFLEIWKQKYPDRIAVEANELNSFYIEDAYPKEYAEDIVSITRAKDFFRGIKPIAGAVETMNRILVEGEFDPYICTAPELDAVDQCCFTEKAQCIEEHLGKEWLKRTIITKDKTLVHGDFLIDDKPEIKGARVPSWERIVFWHKYNVNAAGIHMHGWGDWDNIKHVLKNRMEGKELPQLSRMVA
jgi:5'-nucleotidase